MKLYIVFDQYPSTDVLGVFDEEHIDTFIKSRTLKQWEIHNGENVLQIYRPSIGGVTSITINEPSCGQEEDRWFYSETQP